MMDDQSKAQEDPLIAALPPATDYITYLTLLEYQLTPQNLPTLSRLLTEDDGKLAEEIGWDLLKFLLPMLGPAPEEAVRCMEIVARRGNPREVVVRVAEELEKLGDQDDELDVGDFDDNDDDDDLPTFAGEAPRVHLGNMTLQGMPEAQQHAEGGSSDTTRPLPAATKAMELQALLNMLGILHPRIKTQYPSRFLATSLPAALGAYRQIPITSATTTSFLTMLEKLAGKKRPTLPPRASTTNVNTPPSGERQEPTATPAALPDPEAKAEEGETGVKAPSDEEKAIIHRLLSAVTLEVLDEYLSSLSCDEHPSMSWTARLRETLEPHRVPSLRVKNTELWKETEELKQRDAILAKFHRLCGELDVHAATEIKKVVHDEVDLEDPDQGKEEELSEYPTSPAQIPFPRAGVIFLHAYETFLAPADASPVLSTTELTKLIAHSFPLSATPSIPNPALEDSLLSLLYRHAVSSTNTNTYPDTPPSPPKFLLLISTLTQLFTISPWASLRDSAHYIATRLLQTYPDSGVRLQIITQTLRGTTLSTNWAEIEDEPDATEPGIDEETGLTRSTSALQPHPIPLAPPQQLGALKAIGVNWLKDEFVAWIRDHSTGLDPALLMSADANNTTASETEASPQLLLDLPFPTDLPALSRPPTSSDTESEADVLGPFLLDLPFIISTLNLICVVLPHSPSLRSRAASHVASLTESAKFFVQLLQHATAEEEEGSDEQGGDAFLQESRADIIALQDACNRASAVLRQTGDGA